MTNAEVLINILYDIVGDKYNRVPELINIDDGGATEESMVNYHIDCPSFTGSGLCRDKSYDEVDEKLCIRCKYQWLLEEYE